MNILVLIHEFPPIGGGGGLADGFDYLAGKSLDDLFGEEEPQNEDQPHEPS